ncbi:MAG: DUF4089 domain-containing protein [Comamonadaceae bacterium]|nr:MAG: DUF4089 domain-containing protein [Comamonadaceae bacterium]
MRDEQVLAYVKATAALLALPLDDARAQAVAVHLGRTVALAAMLDAVDMAPEVEPAQVYCPAPFPAAEGAA